MTTTNTTTGTANSNLDIGALIAFEEASEGTEVEVRWTNSFRYYRAIAKVLRVNGKSIRVTVVRAVEGRPEGGYLVGRTLSFPRLYADKWSTSNGVFPVGGAK